MIKPPNASSIEYIKNQIISAFAAVKLEDGIGLWEAQAIDFCKSEKRIQSARNRDIKDNWQKISSNDIESCYSSLFFFDPKGMLFHLPAFIIADFTCEINADIVYHLSQSAFYNQVIFSLFNTEQRQAIATFLEWSALLPEYDFDKPHILRALEIYWYKNDEESPKPFKTNKK
ncbi:MAG: hypothetical protein MJK04_06230 [Psychrosphaera sp.]|nr:hypothetical protein [Psychrosphaera sp.]